MHDFVASSITTFMGFFAIMNPLANAPIFAGLTGGLTDDARKRVAFRATLIAFVIVTVFSIAGHLLFRVFGISLAAFRVAGGILVFLVGKHLLEGKRNSPMQTPAALMHNSSEPAGEAAGESAAEPTSDEAGLAISPLAVPILAGPGTIACAISFSSGRPISEVIVCVLSFAVLCGLTYVVFVGSDKILARIGPYALGVVSRLMGLILAVIGIQMIFHGLSGQFPHLFR